MSEYSTLSLALKAMRNAWMNDGDLSGFDSYAKFISAIKAIESRMFEIVSESNGVRS